MTDDFAGQYLVSPGDSVVQGDWHEYDEGYFWSMDVIDDLADLLLEESDDERLKRLRREEKAQGTYPLPRMRDGSLRKYTEYGVYPLFYVDAACIVLCAECANDSEDEYESGDNERPIAADVNYENRHLHCEECGKRIESAYAEEEEENDDA